MTNDNHLTEFEKDVNASAQAEGVGTQASDPNKKFTRNVLMILAIAIALAAIFALSTVVTFNFLKGSAEVENTSVVTAEMCEHVWVPKTETIHHDAVFEDVEHEATYENVIEYHTVCNICDEVIDGKTAAHKQETGHDTYTTGVAVETSKVATPAWTEHVVVTDAFDEEKVIGATCVKCAEEISVEKAGE